jgi:hypothetical protein
MLDSANIEPTLRSMPPEIITTAMATHTNANSLNSCVVESAFPLVANVATVMEKYTATAASTPSGMAGSIQRFSNSSARNCWRESRWRA